MEETKYRYHIPPCPAYDVVGMERWLEDLAAKGWMLSHDGFFCGVATFEQTPPRTLRFRLEATTTNGGLLSEEYAPDDDAIELGCQMGWTYRARRGQFHIYYTDDPAAPELHTDPQIQAMTIGTLGKYLRQELCHSIILFLLYFWLYFSDITLTAAVTLGSWRIGLLIGLLLWELGRRMAAIVRLSKLKRVLENTGAFPSPDASPAAKQGIVHLLRLGLWLFVCLSLLLRLGAGLTREDTVALEQYQGEIPFATLSDLFPEGTVLPLSGLLDSDVTVWADFLAPESYDYSEYAAVKFSDGTTVDCYLSVEYHRTCWEWTAAGLAREFVRQAGDNPLDHLYDRLWGEEPVESTELYMPEADFAAYYYKYRGSPYLVLQKDCTVMRVNLDVLGKSNEIVPQELATLLLSHIQ